MSQSYVRCPKCGKPVRMEPVFGKRRNKMAKCPACAHKFDISKQAERTRRLTDAGYGIKL